ncbi:MAG: hydroxyquinol 1,2-dioxygenase [Ectothiorhodospiraceae bacterium AqS1]|nr:hydroxyquinol 1,2-dioxygenase [Ectothiorhodospiraceae bacterium AqS1]
MATVFGSLADYAKGGVQVIDDDPKNYVFSNIFEVAAKGTPFERIAVAKNFEYVIEAVRAEGLSPWYACAHDEFALCMDGEIEITLVKLDEPEAAVDPKSQGARCLTADPKGRRMGRMVIRRGHLALLPVGAAYRFEAVSPSAMMIQTIEGPLTLSRWSEICQQD